MKFLVCYEEADPSSSILKEAQAHAKVWNASLVIVKAVTRELPIKHSKILEMEKEMETNVSKQIEDVDITYNVQLLVTSLEPGEKLVKFAEEEEIDLVFIGIIKKSKVSKLLFGSTAQYVILHASCPVVTITV
ncbi:MAG: universal stress protein [Desulfobacterales bacterium]|nr:universal stress protein [Desulfobacterales bacterium]MDX2513253.1 universal stress protein [Desulfobacterales bacterium]